MRPCHLGHRGSGLRALGKHLRFKLCAVASARCWLAVFHGIRLKLWVDAMFAAKRRGIKMPRLDAYKTVAFLALDSSWTPSLTSA